MIEFTVSNTNIYMNESFYNSREYINISQEQTKMHLKIALLMQFLGKNFIGLMINSMVQMINSMVQMINSNLFFLQFLFLKISVFFVLINSCTNSSKNKISSKHPST